MDIAGLSRAFADFAVWDNDGLYALVTVVSIVFTVALIVVVMRKSREHDAARHGQATMSAARQRVMQARATAPDQAATENMPTPTSQG